MATLSKLVVMLLAALSLTVAPVSADPVPGPRVVTLDVPSPLVNPTALGGTLLNPAAGLQVKVLLPAGYDDNPTATYPVLYLLHGANGGSSDYLDHLDIANLLGNVPAVIVMPDGGTYGMYSNWWDKGTLAGPDWTDYHLGTVRALIEQDFRIRAGRQWHAIAGLSMGGQGALRYASMLPGYFGSVAGLSPALPDMRSPIAYGGLTVLVGANGSGLVTYEDIWGPINGYYAKANNPQDLLGNLAGTRVYVASGNGVNCAGDPVNPKSIATDIPTEAGIRLVTNAYASKVRAAGIDITERRTCGVHTWPVWTRDLQDIVAHWGFFGPVAADPTTWTYRTGLQHGSMWQFDFTFAGPMTAVDTFARRGNTLSATGTGTVTLSTDGCTFTQKLPFSRTLPSGCHPSIRE